MFFIISGVMLVVAVCITIFPLIKKGKHEGEEYSLSRKDLNISIYHKKLAELESDFSQEFISKEQYEDAKTELSRSLLVDTDVDVDETGKYEKKGYGVAVAIALCVVLLSITLYQALGNYEIIQMLKDSKQMKPHASSSNSSAGKRKSTMSMEAVFEVMKERAESSPNDPEPWIALGRAYAGSGDYKEAAFTFEKANKFMPDNASIMTSYAEMLAMVDRKNLTTPKVIGLLEKSYSIDPENPQTLLLLGVVYRDIGKKDKGIEVLEKYISILPKSAPNRKKAEEFLDQMRSGG